MKENKLILISRKKNFKFDLGEVRHDSEALSPAELSCVLNWCIEPGEEVLSARVK